MWILIRCVSLLACKIRTGLLAASIQPPTIHSILESWIASSSAGNGKDRKRFIKDYMSNSSDHVLEIVLRQVRQHGSAPLGATASLPSINLLSSSASTPTQSSSKYQAQSATASALPFSLSTPNAPQSAQHAQAPVSLALLGLWQLVAEYAERAGEERMKLEERLGNLVVRCLPQSSIYKSVDAMFREWSSSVGLPLPLPLPSTGSSRKKTTM